MSVMHGTHTSNSNSVPKGSRRILLTILPQNHTVESACAGPRCFPHRKTQRMWPSGTEARRYEGGALGFPACPVERGLPHAEVTVNWDFDECKVVPKEAWPLQSLSSPRGFTPSVGDGWSFSVR